MVYCCICVREAVLPCLNKQLYTELKHQYLGWFERTRLVTVLGARHRSSPSRGSPPEVNPMSQRWYNDTFHNFLVSIVSAMGWSLSCRCTPISTLLPFRLNSTSNLANPVSMYLAGTINTCTLLSTISYDFRTNHSRPNFTFELSRQYGAGHAKDTARELVSFCTWSVDEPHIGP